MSAPAQNPAHDAPDRGRVGHHPAPASPGERERHGFLAEDLPHRRYWRRAEEHLIRALYPRLGAKRTAALLPGRTPDAIKYRAHQLGVRRAFAPEEPA